MYSKFFSRLSSRLSPEDVTQAKEKLKAHFPLVELTTGLMDLDRSLQLSRGQLFSAVGLNSYGESLNREIVKNILFKNPCFKALHVTVSKEDYKEIYETMGNGAQVDRFQINPGVDDTIEQVAQNLRKLTHKYDCILFEGTEDLVSQHVALNKTEIMNRCGNILSHLSKDLSCLILININSDNPLPSETVYYLRPTNGSNLANLSDRSLAVYGNYKHIKILIQKGVSGTKLLTSIDSKFEFSKGISLRTPELVSNQEFVAYLKEIIPGFKTTEFYEILAQSSGYSNWNIAKSKELNFYDYFCGLACPSL